MPAPDLQADDLQGADLATRAYRPDSLAAEDIDA